MSEKEETFGTVKPVETTKDVMVNLDILDIDAGDLDAGIGKEMEQIASAITSLEHYGALLKASQRDGISGQTAQVLHVALSRLDSKFGIRSKLTASLEGHGGSAQANRKVITVSLEFINEQIRALAHRAREMLVKMLQVAKEKAQEVSKGIHTLKSMHDTVRANMPDAPGPNGPDGHQRVVRVDAAKMALIYTDGEFQPASILRLRPLIDLLVNKYPELQTKRFTELAKLIEDGKSIDDLHDWAENDMGSHEGYDYKAKLPGGAMFGDSGFVVEPSEGVPGEWPCRALVDTTSSLRFVEKLLEDLKGLPDADTKLTKATGLVMKALTSGNEVSAEVNQFGLQQVREAMKLNMAVQAYVVQALNAYLTMLVAETNPIGVSSLEWYAIKG